MAIFTAIVGAVGKLFVAGAFKAFLIKTAAQIGVSLLVGLLQKKQKQGSYGVSGTLGVGDEVPRGFALGKSFTVGSLAYANEWGTVAKVPNSYFTQVIALSDLPVKALRRVSINGVWVTLGPTAYLDFGFPVVEYTVSGTAYAWVKFYDGTQVTADSFLTTKVSSADYPYSANRIGRGVAYAIVTARVNDSLFSGFPTWGFELEGVRLYDPSRDTTVGGVGSQRWSNPATWGGDGDDLPAVQAYNVLRGVTYGANWLYGFQGTLAGQLPPASWIQRIAQCREIVVAGAVSEPRFRAGGFVTVDSEVGSVLEAIMASAAGSIAEMGGIYKPVVGVLDAPVATINDEDIVVSEDSTYFPAPRLAALSNGVMCRYPEPEEVWELKDAPAIFRSDLEAKDAGRRLLLEVELSNVPYSAQVQRLMATAIEQARRFRRHVEPLPPKFWRMEPNDVIVRNSLRHGYVEKQFVVKSMTMRADAHIMAELQEVDPADYDFDGWTGYQPIVITPPVLSLPAAFIPTGVAVEAYVIEDAAGGPRKPGIKVLWDGADQDGVQAVEWQVYASGGTLVASNSTTDVNGGFAIVSDGILRATDYTARVRFVGSQPFPWSPLTAPVTSPDVGITGPDIADGAIDDPAKIVAGVVSTRLFVPLYGKRVIDKFSIATRQVLTDPASFQAVALEPDLINGGYLNPVRFDFYAKLERQADFTSVLAFGFEWENVGAPGVWITDNQRLVLSTIGFGHSLELSIAKTCRPGYLDHLFAPTVANFRCYAYVQRAAADGVASPMYLENAAIFLEQVNK